METKDIIKFDNQKDIVKSIYVISYIDDIYEEIMSDAGIKEILQELKNFSRQIYVHSLNASRRAILICMVEGYDKETIKEIATAAILMDVGYIDIPKNHLNKSSMLEKSEYERLKYHVICSANIAEELGLSKEVVRMIMEHHEKEDGTGYPNNKKSNEIAVGSKIISASDCYEALVEERPYRSAFTIRGALDSLYYQAGECHDINILYMLAKSLLIE